MAFRLDSFCLLWQIFHGTQLRFFRSGLNNYLLGSSNILCCKRISNFLFRLIGFNFLPKILLSLLLLGDHLIKCHLCQATSTFIHRIQLSFELADDPLFYFLLADKWHGSLHSVVGLKTIKEGKVIVPVCEEGRSSCYWYPALGKRISKGVIHHLDSLGLDYIFIIP